MDSNDHDDNNEDDAGKKSSWRSSKAKSLLENMLRTDQIPETMLPKEVYNLRQEFIDSDPKYKNWSSRLRSLRKTIKMEKDRNSSDELALVNFRMLHPEPTHDHHGRPLWDKSQAKILLRLDMDAGKDLTMTPSELWSSRQEYYDEFTLLVFRKHIYQERRTRKWYESKERAKQSKKGKQRGGVVLPVDLS